MFIRNPFSHLIIFVHGLHGDSKDGAYLKKEFLKKYKDNSIIYVFLKIKKILIILYNVAFFNM